jgi:hypothetical protein
MLPPTHVSGLGLQNLSNGLTILKQLYLSKQFRPANLYAQKLKENISLKKITSLYFFNLSVISSEHLKPVQREGAIASTGEEGGHWWSYTEEHRTASMLHPLALRCGEPRRVTRVLLPAYGHLVDGSFSAAVAD